MMMRALYDIDPNNPNLGQSMSITIMTSMVLVGGLELHSVKKNSGIIRYPPFVNSAGPFYTTNHCLASCIWHDHAPPPKKRL